MNKDLDSEKWMHFQIDFQQINTKVFEYYQSWLQRKKFLPSSIEPWLPVGRLGPCIILTHYHPIEEHMVLPSLFLQKILVSKTDYQKLLEKYVHYSHLHNKNSLKNSISESNIIQVDSDKMPNKVECENIPDIQNLKAAFQYILQDCPLELHVSHKIEAFLQDIVPLEDIPQEYLEACLRLTTRLMFLDLSILKLNLDLNRILPISLLERYQAIILAVDASQIWIAISKIPLVEFEDLILYKSNSKFTKVNFIIASEYSIVSALEEFKKRITANSVKPKSNFTPSLLPIHQDSIILDGSMCANIIPLDSETSPEEVFQWILHQALLKKASDIHIEQIEGGGRIRIRVDGYLIILLEIPIDLVRSLTMVCKNACRMKPNDFDNQDAAFGVVFNQQFVNIRVNAIPFRNSFQKLALRLLAQSTNKITINDLDIPSEQIQFLRKCLTRPQGLIIVSGPTGEGKTTTLYAMLEELNKVEKNIQTIEDPIERQISGVNQTAVDLARGVTFASVMRSIVRQDPDVILLGEIRDKETAELAIESSLTGHLVLTTLHANSSIKALSRLYQLGTDPHLLASSLILLQAQRLVKKLCSKCKEVDVENQNFFKAKGCEWCNQTGFRGRLPIMEFFPICEEAQEAISQKASFLQLKRTCKNKNYKNLYEEALQRAKEGVIQSLDAQLYLEN